MTTPAEYLAAAASDVGYTENPSGSNRTKFAREAGLPDGYAWCMTFLEAVAKRVGLVLPLTASTRTFWGWAQRGEHGLSVVTTGDARPGDFVLYDWPGGNTPTDHVEVLESKGGPLAMVTIGGNTSFDNNGSQTNGGAVARRHRSFTNVRGFVRPPYSTEDDMPLNEDDKKYLDERVTNEVLRHVDPLADVLKRIEAKVDALSAGGAGGPTGTLHVEGDLSVS